MFLDF